MAFARFSALSVNEASASHNKMVLSGRRCRLNHQENKRASTEFGGVADEPFN
jgi:hypothetical protein